MSDLKDTCLVIVVNWYRKAIINDNLLRLSHFPVDLSKVIAKYAAKWELLWIEPKSYVYFKTHDLTTLTIDSDYKTGPKPVYHASTDGTWANVAILPYFKHIKKIFKEFQFTIRI